MAIDLNHEICAHCGTRLTDPTAVVENEGTLYCCGNCFAAATGNGIVKTTRETGHCSHCGVAIIDQRYVVRRGVRVYCCNNCANAPERELVGRPA